MIKFIHASKSDIPLLQQLAHTVWHKHYPGIISVEQISFMLEKMYSSSQILKEIEAGYYWVLIYFDSQPIGLMSYHLDENIQIKLKLDKLYILLTYHGKGVGQASLGFVKSEAKRLCASSLYLAVNKQNTKAIQAYKRAGFSVESEVVTDIGDGYIMDDYIMSISI